MGTSGRSDPHASVDDRQWLFDRVPGAIYRCEIDASRRIVELSEGVAAFTGRSAAEFLDGRTRWADVVAPDDRQTLPETVMDRAVPGREFSFEYRVVHVDGTIRWVHDSSRVVVDANGRRCLVGVLIDVTAGVIERKRAEEALRDSEGRYRTAFCATPDAVNVNRSSDGLFLDVNEGFVRNTGWSAEELVGKKTSRDIGIWVDMADRQRLIETLGRHGYCTNLEAVFRRKDGGTLTCLMSAGMMSYRGEPCILSVTRDITEIRRGERARRELEEQLQQAQKLESLGVLAGGVAHDFNNILMAVLGHAELALDELSPMSGARGSLTEIVTAARRAAELCRQMLAYSGRATFAVERVDLRELVEEMLHLLKTSISKKAVLNVQIDPGLPPIEADPTQIRQVVMNLVLNASEAIGDRNGVIALSASAVQCDEKSFEGVEPGATLRSGWHVQLEVADTGAGMTPEVRSRIFEPFFTTKFSGRGLGLAALLGIVRAHHGAIKVQSEPGKGSRFTLLFPVLAETGLGAPLAAETPQNGWRGSGTVLFADDEESLCLLAAKMLRRLGYRVITAKDGLEAVSLFRSRRAEIDLVILDLTMPRLDGAQAFAELRALDPDVRVVLASGYTPEDVSSRAGVQGLAGVLQKPYTLSRMRDVLSNLAR
jgi:two-component system, cell cycle sensor histidine kinase and response regulator CckA